ncbi:MAG: XRE family transcriptional regulator [Acidobacteriota bacterium]|nr:XRE family transcriptional regulator [Acidobacteriota bacterium]
MVKKESVANSTVADGLKPYLIGEKLRGLRLRKSMGLVELGRHTKLSPAMLSKLERGKLFPTLPTLLRIAMVFSVGLDYFFTDERKRRVVAVIPKGQRLRFPENPKEPEVSYYFESLDFPVNERRLTAFYAEFQMIPSENLKAHQHPGIEFIYLISGKLELRIASDEYLLDAGDSIYFDSGVRHSYRNPVRAESSALVVTVP